MTPGVEFVLVFTKPGGNEGKFNDGSEVGLKTHKASS
jgi:hypothetical protein